MAILQSTTAKVLASLALVGSAAAVAGLGTYGGFTSSTAASAAVDTGIMSIGLGGAGGVNNLGVAAEGLLPGDRMERLVTLVNDGTTNLGSVTLSTSASIGSALITDTVKGLQLGVQSCPVAWSGAAAPYTCNGVLATVLASTPVIGTYQLSALTSLTKGKSDHLKVTATLPATADNSFQGLRGALDFRFDSTQPASASK